MSVLLSTKLKNELKSKKQGLNFYLKNIIINGSKRGCSGFVQDSVTGNTVYVNTDISIGENKNLYRVADGLKDYSGKIGFNKFATNEMLADKIIFLLNNPDKRWDKIWILNRNLLSWQKSGV